MSVVSTVTLLVLAVSLQSLFNGDSFGFATAKPSVEFYVNRGNKVVDMKIPRGTNEQRSFNVDSTESATAKPNKPFNVDKFIVPHSVDEEYAETLKVFGKLIDQQRNASFTGGPLAYGPNTVQQRNSTIDVNFNTRINYANGTYSNNSTTEAKTITRGNVLQATDTDMKVNYGLDITYY